MDNSPDAAEREMIDFTTLEAGASAERSLIVSDVLIANFALWTGDTNPLHTDASFAARTHFGRVNAQGQLMTSIIVGVIGSCMPGPGWFCLGVNADFVHPCFPGDSVVALVRLKQKVEALHVAVWDGWLKRSSDGQMLVRASIKTKFMGRLLDL